MNRTIEAFTAAQRLISAVESMGINIFDYNDIEDIAHNGYSFFPSFLHYEWGASRIVIYDDNCDYVIKIARDVCFEKYNQREVEIYEAAKEEGYEEYFGWCACYIEPSWGIPGIYVMEFLDGDSDEVIGNAYDYGYQSFCNAYDLDTSEEESMEKYSYERPDDEEELMDYLMSTVDPELTRAFNIFIARWAISDIHSANVLFRNGKPVICDYAGWGW